MLLAAIITITTALLLYSLGVWSERIQGTLKRWHLVIFFGGLVFDTTGTTIMSILAGEGFSINFHAVTGIIAIVLMLFHAVWAAIVLYKNDEKAKTNFHKFSLFVWIIWLIPFISGAMFGMAK